MRADVGAQLRKGVVEYCVLGLLAREPMYGWQLSETLGLVSSFDEESDAGPVRKYYRLTDAGIRELAEFRLQWAPFSRTVDELIEEEHRVEEHHAKERNVEEDHHA